MQSIVPFAKNNFVSVKQIHNLNLSYIIEEMRPLNTVYKPAFKNLICGIANNTSENILPGKSALSTEINKLYKEKKSRLKALLEKQNYVCLTSDIWSCRNKSYLGMTIHFISETLERKSYTLACKRILYNHTYDNIALMMHHILKEFALDVAKVTHIVTDNASNFGKVFRCFGVTRFESSDRIQLNVEENEDILNDIEESDSDIEINETSPNNDIHDHDNALTDELGDEIILPPQLTCSSHTLNLIATTDCKKILDNPGNAALKKVYRSAFAKVSALWNLLSRSTLASDICFKECGCKFPVPVITRWNSQFDAIQKLLTRKTKLIILFEQLKLQKLRLHEIEFLEEFVMIMCPLATSLDILQGEKMCFLGMIAPTIIILKQKLSNFTHLSYCKPLVDGMIVALEKRFKHIYDFDSPDSKIYIISATQVEHRSHNDIIRISS
ncbi:uncharacterized protein [Temnothorax nylanderi]|uniref:uncharacterized protein isoform X2 n=1 Tax=Temnothorax nylanderi TaxID=102681 RepID=UPI003A893061